MKRHKKTKKNKPPRKKQAQHPINWLSQTAQSGVHAYHKGDLNLAREYLEKVLEQKPDHLDALHYLGLIAQEQGQYPRAIFLLDQAAKHQPEHPLHHNNLANVYAECGRLDKAIHCYEKALQASPVQPDILYNLANIQCALSLREEAQASYSHVLELQSDHTNARLALADMHADQGELDLADMVLLPLLQQQQNNAKVQTILAKIRLLRGDLESAEGLLQKCYCDPDNPKQWTIRLLSLFHNQASESLVSSLRNYPGQSLEVFHELLGLLDRQQAQGLADSYVEAMRQNDNDSELQMDLLNKLLFHKLYSQAQELGQTLLKMYPESITVINSIGISLSRQSQFSEAMPYFHKALQYGYDLKVMANAAFTLYMMRHYEKAESFYCDLLANAPDNTTDHSTYLLSLHYNPQATKKQIYTEHLRWDQQHAICLLPSENIPAMQASSAKSLRIGFTSGSFNRHPVGFFLLGLLQNWDPEWANIYLYSDTKNPDDFTELIQSQNLVWRDTTQLSDNELTKLIQTDAIDILIDLSGHAEGSRLLAFARKPAPIQVKWVGGQFNTTGMQAMDYFFTDWVESPPGEEEWFTENLVRLPDGYVSYTPPDYAPEVGLLPALRNRYVTFGCFNNLAKINQDVARVWSEILRRVPRSKLVLKSHQLKDPEVADELYQEFQDFGISPERLDLRQPSPHSELLAQYNDIDIALDPFPYSGGLTTCEAMWMGVPVLTKPGQTFAGRHAASHVSNVGLTDWIVDSEDAYIETAVKWAKNLGGLTKLRAGLREQMRNSPLCDHELFARNFRDAMYWMWQDKMGEKVEPKTFNIQEKKNEKANTNYQIVNNHGFKNIFICGCGHSGTTLMVTLLGKHEKIYSIPYETEAFLHDRDLNESKKILDSNLKCSLNQNKKIVCEKTPRHVRCIDKILTVFPKAKFILMVRHPLDVVGSLKRRSQNFDLALKRYIVDNKYVLNNIDKSNIFLLRYEDIISNPEHIIYDICEFLNIEYDQNILNNNINIDWNPSIQAKLTDGVGLNHDSRRKWQMSKPITDYRGTGALNLTHAEKQKTIQETEIFLNEFEYEPHTISVFYTNANTT